MSHLTVMDTKRNTSDKSLEDLSSLKRSIDSYKGKVTGATPTQQSLHTSFDYCQRSGTRESQFPGTESQKFNLQILEATYRNDISYSTLLAWNFTKP